MTQDSQPAAAAAEDPPHPHTTQGLARLMLSAAFQEVAEDALGGIATGSDRHAGPGEFVELAHRLVRQAEEVLRCAVIYERERRTSWEDIGEALGVTKQTAHKRFAEAVEQWREPLEKPAEWAPDGTPRDKRIPYPAREPDEYAEHLDRWLRARTTGSDPWSGDDRPVSAGLDRHTTLTAHMLLTNISRRLLEEQLVPDPQRRADVAERSADLMERLMREGGAPPEAAEWIARDRARAAALRATPGRGVPWEEFAGAGPDEPTTP